jgi:fermentation-respiration switch protein FrsA (DUF1100 family)
MNIIKLAIFLGLSIIAASCLRLDDSMFNQTKLESYALADSVIPASAREFVTLKSQGVNIYGYYITSNGEHPETTILYCHGNRDHLQFYWDRAELLYKTGCNVFIFDYEGFGMSEGAPSEENIYADGRAARDYLGTKDTTVKHICYYGFSLGSTVAVELAANYQQPYKLITEAALASSDALVRSGTILDMPHGYVIDGVYDNIGKISKVHCPLLMLHGTADKFIDLEKNSQQIYKAANDPKQFIKIDGADHSEIPDKMGRDVYVKTIKDFITQ